MGLGLLIILSYFIGAMLTIVLYVAISVKNNTETDMDEAFYASLFWPIVVLAFIAVGLGKYIGMKLRKSK